MTNRMTINDPLYGFIHIPRGILIDIITHPYFQRLGRIRQLGLAPFVYPGARHTRFLHSLGAFHLVNQALRTLTDKGHFIFDSEAEATQIAVLLHDVGHGPFSHVLEHELIDVSHEDISLLAMRTMNEELGGALTAAIQIFQDKHPKRFLHQLICSQLDVDRLDYLCRDSFFTGVSEGDIGSARLLQMLNVYEDRLVIDSKGLFSVENYLMARRLMYWQVYLHKTTLAAEQVLCSALRRAKHLASRHEELFCTPALRTFLYNNVSLEDFTHQPTLLSDFMLLDDSDIITAIKVWQSHSDVILSHLSRAFTDRKLFKAIEITEDKDEAVLIAKYTDEIAHRFSISEEEAGLYFIGKQTLEKEMYTQSADHISILHADGRVSEMSEVSKIVGMDKDSVRDSKRYLFVPK